MKTNQSKLRFLKESVRVLSQPELNSAVGGITTAITCTCGPSIYDYCTMAISCASGCDTA